MFVSCIDDRVNDDINKRIMWSNIQPFNMLFMHFLSQNDPCLRRHEPRMDR